MSQRDRVRPPVATLVFFRIQGLPKAFGGYLARRVGCMRRATGHVSCLPWGTCEAGIGATGLDAGVGLTLCIPGAKAGKTLTHTHTYTIALMETQQGGVGESL